MTNTTPDTREEAASKLPALHVLMIMGWSYLPPADATAMRGSDRSVLLEPVLREWLGAHRFDFKGQRYPLSESGINQVIKAISATKLNEGLIAANEAIYKQLTLGITVDEFVGGQKTSVTVPLINWNDTDANRFHVTEELSVERPAGMGRYRPDVVCYVNGLPFVVIEAKRPTSSSENKSMVAEGISQHNRNQKVSGIQNLYAYSQLLLSISGTDARYGTTDTPSKFWGKWTEEEITEAQMQEVKSTPLSEAQKAALFADKPHWARNDFERLHSGLVMLTEQDRLIISLLRPDRLLDFTRRFIFFDRGTKKIAARYQQFGGVKAILAQVAKQKPDGSREGGVIWHTTGSGKSNLMVLLTKALLLDPELANSRIIIVTDRVDLEKQLAATFLTGGAFGVRCCDEEGWRKGESAIWS